MAEQAGGTGWRCASDTSGSGPSGPLTRPPRPAGMPVPGDPGLHPGDTTVPPARSLADQTAQMPFGKRGPGPKRAAMERRKARLPAPGSRPRKGQDHVQRRAALHPLTLQGEGKH
jgi:hypothetical protein